jgi:hypothetical protein
VATPAYLTTMDLQTSKTEQDIWQNANKIPMSSPYPHHQSGTIACALGAIIKLSQNLDCMH